MTSDVGGREERAEKISKRGSVNCPNQTIAGSYRNRLPIARRLW